MFFSHKKIFKEKFFKTYFLYIVLVLMVGIQSCSQSDNPENKPAQLMTLAQIESTPGYEWFSTEYNSFKPDTNYTIKIKNFLADSPRKFLVFVNPSCGCQGTQVQFPNLMKIITSSAVPDKDYEIYSMLSYIAPQPYKSIFTLTSLPSMYVLKNDTTVYSVLDTLNYYKALHPDSTFELEPFIWNGIHK